MTSPLLALEPRAVWAHFDAIRHIPRPSRHEEKIVAHLTRWAENRGFGLRQDAAGNLAIDVPPSPGHATAGGVVLQAHLDMVCEKNAGTEHDFLRDPIEVAVERGWVRAVGTTLGADNGIGVAAAMAIAEEPGLVHGPLELLFTLDEETGLNGARRLDGSLVRGRWLINLDTEEEALYIGCAGAAGITARLPLERVAGPPGRLQQLAVRGLRGGHSGLEIALPHANALQLITRVLSDAGRAGFELRLSELWGGSKPNAIAREAFAAFELDAMHEPVFASWLETERLVLMTEHGAAEPDLSVELAPAAARPPLAPPTQARLLQLLAALPHGPLSFSAEVAGLVETSVNLAVLTTDDVTATLTCSCRSSVESARAKTVADLEAAARQAGAEVEIHPGYPGWQPDPQAPLVQITAAVFERLFGHPPLVKAVHAGLECGILIEKIPGLSAVSIGPEIRGAHSPDERVGIASVATFYRHLRSLVETLSHS